MCKRILLGTMAVVLCFSACHRKNDLQKERDAINDALQRKDVRAINSIVKKPQENWNALKDDLIHHRVWHVWSLINQRVLLNGDFVYPLTPNPIKVHISEENFDCHVFLTPGDVEELSQIHEIGAVGTYGVVTGINPFTKHVTVESIKTECTASE